MIVVSNTTPINYLVLIGEVDLLAQLFGRLLIPAAVLQELRSPLSPRTVRELGESRPPWIEVRSPTAGSEPELLNLQPGEREAIQLASQVGARLLLMDERAGRRFAAARGLRVAGTLAVLADGARRGLIDFGPALERLRQTSFHASEPLLQFLSERYGTASSQRDP